MIIIKLVYFLVLVLVLLVSHGTSEEVGVAHIEGVAAVGHVYFVTMNTSMVWVWANITFAGDTSHAATHAMHVHTYGDINSPAGAYVGGHFVGSGIDVHGCEGNSSRQEGDMGNWQVQNGVIAQNKYLDLLALSGTYSIIGRGVVLHENEDDCLNSTISGARIAQGVIGIANLTNLPSDVAAMLQTSNTSTNTNTANSSGIATVSPAATQLITSAVVVLSPLSPANITGLVTFEENENGTVTVKAVIHGLDPSSAYGFHIHTFGDLHSSDGSAAGSHYNPSSSPHGIPDSPSRHVGDLGNICTYDVDGHTAYYQHTFDDVITLSGLNNVIGRTIIIHSKFDDGGSVFGSRIAQGVIGIGNLFTSLSFPPNVSFQSPACEAYSPDPPLQIGVAYLVGTAADPNVTGTVYFVTVNSSPVWVWVHISNISYNPNNYHGLHVHTFGDITNAEGTSVGGHYVAGGGGGDVHACEYTTPRHEGDMGNWKADGGAIMESKTLDLLALTGAYSIIGRGVILHNNTDDCKNTNSSGARLAQGVIGIANPSTTYLPPQVTMYIANPTTTITNTASSGLPETSHAVAVLSPASGSNVSGLVVFHQFYSLIMIKEGNRTTITAKITGLSSSNAYGFHIHIFGDINSSDGNAASSHYNPYNASHGLASNSSRHVGDLGNICSYGEDGTAYYNYTFDSLVSLGGENNVIGRAVIIHAIRDDGVSTIFGTRIAQGVIGIANSTDLLTIPDDIDFSDSPACIPYVKTASIGVAHLVGDSFDPTIDGFVYFVTLNATHTWVWANITRITSNSNAIHGLHIHSLGDTNDKDKALFVGGHYLGVTGSDVHACENTTQRHEGDMGNWMASSGTIWEWKTIDLVALSGPFSVIGRAVVLHNLSDDCSFTNSSGNRLAQGVIGIANPEFLPPQVQAVASTSIDSINNATSGEALTKAMAVITPTSGSIVRGIVTFEQNGGSLTVKAQISGLPDPTHAYGFHIHIFGDMSLTNGKGASTHYNPFNASHGLPPSSDRHVGDLGNICTFGPDGTAYYSYTFTSLLLTLSPGNASIIGRSVIIHSIPDNMGTSFGPMIGQGVIGYGSINTNVTLPPSLIINHPDCSDYHVTTTSASTSSSSSGSVTTGLPPTSPPSHKKGGMSGGAKVGIAFLVIIVLIIVAANALYYNRFKRFPWTKPTNRYSGAIDYVAFEDKDFDDML